MSELPADAVREFVRVREWTQFHDPKNLTMALSAEVGELSDLFRWLTSDESAAIMSTPQSANVADEVADVAIYLLLLADALDLDLGEAMRAKLQKNEARYPVERSRGNAQKYTAFDQ